MRSPFEYRVSVTERKASDINTHYWLGRWVAAKIDHADKYDLLIDLTADVKRQHAVEPLYDEYKRIEAQIAEIEATLEKFGYDTQELRKLRFVKGEDAN